MSRKSAVPTPSAASKRKPAATPAKTPAISPKTKPRQVAKQQSAHQPDVSLPKKDQLIALLKSPSGTTIHAMTDLTGWQAHTVRGVISAVLRKKLGLNVICEKTGLGHQYKIVATKA